MEKLKKWEQRSDKIYLTYDEIKHLLEKASIVEEDFSFTLANNGLSNTNYIIKFNNRHSTRRPVVLRINARDETLSQKEFNISKLLHGEILVPKILYIHSPDKDTKFPYSILEYCEGVLLSDLLMMDTTPDSFIKIYIQLGKFLSNLSRYQFEKAGSIDVDMKIREFHTHNSKYNPLVNYILDQTQKTTIKEKLGGQLHEDLENKIIEYENFFPSTRSQLVHGDFKPSNILVKEEEGKYILSGIIDWEFAYSGSVYSDIGNLFRFSHPYDGEFKASFIKGYSEQAYYMLNSDWERKAKLVDLINLCDLLDSNEHKPNLYSSVVKLIEETVEFIGKS